MTAPAQPTGLTRERDGRTEHEYRSESGKTFWAAPAESRAANVGRVLREYVAGKYGTLNEHGELCPPTNAETPAAEPAEDERDDGPRACTMDSGGDK